MIRNSDIRISADFKSFFPTVKTRKELFELMEEVWAESEAEIGERIFYVARGRHCRRIS